MLLGDATGMQAIVTQLTTGLTPANILGIVGDIVPFLIAIIPVSLGIYFLRRMIKGFGNKGKVKM